MEETGKAGKKSNIEINADKGAKQNSHPGILRYAPQFLPCPPHNLLQYQIGRAHV